MNDGFTPSAKLQWLLDYFEEFETGEATKSLPIPPYHAGNETRH